MRKRIFVTREIPKPGLDLLREHFDLTVNMEDRVLSREEIIEGVRQADGLLCLLTDTIDAEVMDANPGLQGIANYAVGYNNIDVKAATERKIPVSNTPGVLTETTADFAWALLMAISRRVVEGDLMVRQGEFKGWGPMLLLGGDVTGKTMGIVGFGRIGRAMAARARGFDMKIVYYNNERLSQEEEADFGVEYLPMEELLQASDYVSLHVPLLPETTHMISEKEFRLMKETAYIINTARGPVIDEKALVRALREGWIRGAGLDVFEEEPVLAPGLAELPNVVLAPHIASATVETRTKMSLMAAENLVAALKGETPPNIVNRGIYG